jgi:hypothetical protein
MGYLQTKNFLSTFKNYHNRTSTSFRENSGIKSYLGNDELFSLGTWCKTSAVIIYHLSFFLFTSCETFIQKGYSWPTKDYFDTKNIRLRIKAEERIFAAPPMPQKTLAATAVF